MKEYKLIITGDRNFTNYSLLSQKIFDYINNDACGYAVSIVSGMAKGADLLAARFARQYRVHLYEFPTDWSQGPGAGYARNRTMADFADAALVFGSRDNATRHLIEYMESLGKSVSVVRY
jgi:hypothetical protein